MVFTYQTKGNTDIIDITQDISKAVEKSKVKEGIASVFVKGSTAAITAIEADENLYDDLRQVLDDMAPMDKDWKHHQTWGDRNGGSHIRASIIGPDVNIPIVSGKLIHGTWQKIVMIDFDTHPRERTVYVSCIGK